MNDQTYRQALRYTSTEQNTLIQWEGAQGVWDRLVEPARHRSISLGVQKREIQKVGDYMKKGEDRRGVYQM